MIEFELHEVRNVIIIDENIELTSKAGGGKIMIKI